MACAGQYASASDYDQFWGLALDVSDPKVVSEINRLLSLAAADIYGPLSSVGACDCVSGWGVDYLKKLNIIDAAVTYDVSCGPRLKLEERKMWLEWLNNQFEQIRLSQLDVCGQTGAQYPAWGNVELNLTDWNAGRIIRNRIQRNGM